MKVEKLLREVRKEDDLYYHGVFWIVADSYRDIQRGNFAFVGEKIPCSYAGERTRDSFDGRSKTHKSLWKANNGYGYSDKPYDYFPRGRVSIYQGTAYVNIHGLCNTPKVVNAIIREFNLQNLELELECNDETQGHHYDFKLE